MSAALEDDDEIELVPVPMDRATRARLARFARLSGDRAVMAAGAILRDVLADEDFWEAAEDPTGVEPRTVN